MKYIFNKFKIWYYVHFKKEWINKECSLNANKGAGPVFELMLGDSLEKNNRILILNLVPYKGKLVLIEGSIRTKEYIYNN